MITNIVTVVLWLIACGCCYTIGTNRAIIRFLGAAEAVADEVEKSNDPNAIKRAKIVAIRDMVMKAKMWDEDEE